MNEISNPTPKPRLANNNYILNALPEEDFARLLPDLEPVEFTIGQVIYQPEEKIKHL